MSGRDRSTPLSLSRPQSFLPLLVLVTLSSTHLLIAQAGQNAVMKDATTPINSPSFFDATRFDIGGDACQQIAFTFNDPSFPSTGGTVDARGLAGNGTSPLICSVNPIPSGAKGRLLLSSGTYLAQVPWVVQSNDVNIIGTGGGGTAGNTNTMIQACKSGQSNCNQAFPSGRAVIEVGPTPGGQRVFQVTVKELNVDCQDAPGVSGVSVIAAQEETVLDLVKAIGCRVAGFDIGKGDTEDQNGAALSNFYVQYPNGSGCPGITPGTIAGVLTPGVSRTGGVVTVNLTGIAIFPPLVPGYEVVIAGVSDGSFNGTYRVQAVNSPTQFTYLQNNANNINSGGGMASLYPVGVRVWQTSGSPVRPIINGTINGVNCSSPPPIAMELSGGFPFVHNIHTEGFDVGVQLGDLSGTNGATLSNLKLDNKTKTGVFISNQWTTSGGAPEALPTGNINIFNLDVTGGDGNTLNSIDDRINNNTLTKATNGTVGYYLYGSNGVMTSAVPENGLKNAFDINNQMLAIYSGSSSAAFSAGSSGVSTAHYLGVQTTGPTCAFTSGGGTGPGCSVDTGSTDSVGTIIASTGTGSPQASGTITLTFNSNLGSNRPSCVFTPSDKGTGTWSALAVMKDKTPAVGSDLFIWTNGTGPALTVGKTYWINYFCGGR